MTLTNPYCTEIQLRAHFRDVGERLDADGIERSISSASRWIDKTCGRRFWQDSTVQVRTYYARDSYEIWVDDISTTTGLIVKTGSGGTYSTTWSSTSYELHPRDGELDDITAYAWWRIKALDGAWPIATRTPTVQITAKFGWSTVPVEVEEACILKAASLYQRRESPLGVASFGDFGPVRIGRFDPDVTGLLIPYIKVGFG